jgi:hypothetical protein
VSSSSSSRPSSAPRAIAAALNDDQLNLTLSDGRQLAVPITWFGWLSDATAKDRQDVTLIEDGAGIWWPRLDEGLSVAGLLGIAERG